MNRILFLTTIGIAAILMSCSTSNDVVSNHGISKRKYQKGFHINKRHARANAPKQIAELDNENIEEKAERTPIKTVIASKKNDATKRLEAQLSDIAQFVQPQVKDNESAVDVKETEVNTKDKARLREKIKSNLDRSIGGDDTDFEVISLSMALISLFLIGIPVVNIILPSLGLYFSTKAIQANPDSALAKVARNVSIAALVFSILYTLFYIGYFFLLFFLFA